MARWLFKEEPDHYSFADLCRDGRTRWDGVSNNLARQHLRKVRCGDRIFFYHTGKEKAVVGLMQAVSDAMTDPDSDDPRAVVVEVEPERELLHKVTLTEIKQDPLLADWDLVRLPRLSVVPVTEAQWKRVLELAEEGKAERRSTRAREAR
ncbi:MAG TPA: EVE domain-containing protein [Gemmataceae bacterium]|nr:EVE domain-containing protein [Gemmataceae bacterium]